MFEVKTYTGRIEIGFIAEWSKWCSQSFGNLGWGWSLYRSRYVGACLQELLQVHTLHPQK